MTQANTSDLGRRLGPADIPASTPSPTDLSTPQQPTTPTTAATITPTAEVVAAPKPTFWTVDQAQAAGTLDPTFGSKMDRLIAASAAAGYPLHVNSGFRTVEEQKQVVANAIAKHGPGAEGYWAAAPGHSNHNRGEAVDLGGDTTWAHQHAAQFGLVFPMSWEPWHIEPQGLRADSTPQAYTTGPVGTVNPTQDTALDSSPHEIAAATSNLFSGSWMPGDQSLPAGTANQYGLPTVSGTRSESLGTGPAMSPAPAGGTQGGGASVPASASQQSFIDTIRPYAEAESKRTGIPAEVFITQSGVETGWGTSGWWRNQLNPAGIGVTGAAGAGSGFPNIETAFRSYADHLMGVGEAGQEKFVADVKAGAGPAQLLADLEASPWAAGHYGGNGLTNTYSALASSGAFNPPAAPAAQPAPAAPAEPLQPVTRRRNF